MAGGPFFGPDPAGDATPAYNADPSPHFATRCDSGLICVNSRPFAVYQRLFDPFFAIFAPPDPQKPHFRRFFSPIEDVGAPK